MMLSNRLKELREGKGLLQRQVANMLDVDTAYVSKLENNEKPISRKRVSQLAEIYSAEEKELLLLWLSDKVYDTVIEEDFAVKSLELTIKRVKQK